LPDSAFWHKFFEFAERRKILDIILVDKDGKHVSFKKDSAEDIASSDTVLTLHKLSEIKNKGHRIFFVGHHEGYLGPYFVRSVIRKLGFHNLTQNCNTVVGPRMFSNVVLRNGAANVGNLFITVPSQKTTVIKTGGLAEELRKTAKRTQCLIKLPDAGLYLIKKLPYEDFMSAMVNGAPEALTQHTSFLDMEEKNQLADFLETENFAEAMKDFSKEDYELFKKIMKETFLIFPEGSRSYIDPDGAVVMKYVNPKYLQSYMRPGDFIAPINLVGGSELTRGWHLRSATLGISIGEPIEVTAEMIRNYEEEGVNVMRNIARLPNIKDVRFKDEIQYKRETSEPV
jgi:1-acyl-sn-glycerol-3-phosphate acyltransferase